MRAITKDWGTQIWLGDYDLLMVMKAGGKTSVHCHPHYDTTVWVLQGVAHLSIRPTDKASESVLNCDDGETIIHSGQVHQITAVTDCVLYEKYSTSPKALPEYDIERLRQC